MKPENIGNHVTSFTYGYGQQPLCIEQTYNALVDQFIKQSSKSNKNKTTLASLMTETAPNRHKWIIEDKPFISDILSKFPAFKDYDMLLVDLCILTGIQEPEKNATKHWNMWVPKILYKGKLAHDHKKTYENILTVMEEMNKVPSECLDPDASIILLLLRKLLNSKMSKELNELLIVLEDGDNIEMTASDNSSSAPYIMQVGPATTRQWFVVVEKTIILEVNTIIKAIIAMI